MRSFQFFALSVAIIVGSITYSSAQENDILPRWLTDIEKAALAEYSVPGVTRGKTSPPSGDIRPMAEWEELQAIVVTWRNFPDILAEIVRYAKEEVEVLIVTNNQAGVAGFLASKGIDSDNISFLNESSNSIWVRDYGPNSVYLNDVDSLYLIDWIYNRPRPGDDLVPDGVGEFLGLPVYSNTEPPYDLVHTGGNFMTDGINAGFSSNLVLDENGPGNLWGSSIHDETAVDSIMARYMGIEGYIKMTNLPFDGIHHIDMHMKLLDERTIIVGQYPQGVADGPQIEANIQYVLSNFVTDSGNPYRVIRVPMPPDYANRYPDQNGDYRTYANFVFVNKTVLVPIYEERYDTTGLRIIRESLPGYNVVGIDCNAIIPYGGAIHCITKEIGSDDPLWIAHEVLDDVMMPQAGGYPVEATVKHKSGIDSVLLFFQIEGQSDYSKLIMSRVDQDLWTSIIPEQNVPGKIKYYFKAFAASGKSQVRPLPAPEGYFSFYVNDVSTNLNKLSEQTISFKIYPNPAKAITCIELDKISGPGKGSMIRMTNIDGKILKEWSTDDTSNFQRFFFDANDLLPGMYLVTITGEMGHLTQKLLVH